MDDGAVAEALDALIEQAMPEHPPQGRMHSEPQKKYALEPIENTANTTPGESRGVTAARARARVQKAAAKMLATVKNRGSARVGIVSCEV